MKYSENSTNYKTGTAFDAAGQRAKRIAKRQSRNKMSKDEFARKVRAEHQLERAVLLAIRKNDDLALKTVATEVALYALRFE